MSDPEVAWAHNWETYGNGTIPVVTHATLATLESVQPGGASEWHRASAAEYELYEQYWAKEFPHMGQYIIEERPL